MHLIRDTEVKFVMHSVLTKIAIRVKLIGKCASRPDAFFLMSDELCMHWSAIDLSDLFGGKPSRVRWNLLELCLLDADEKPVASERVERWLFGIVRPEDRSQISGDGSPPCADILFANRLPKLALN